MSRLRERFREILAGPGCTAVAPIFDTLSARIADMLGWEVCKLSGSVGKAAALAVPDGAPVVNMSDLTDACRRITRVADVCLIVDADDGGGGALSVLRTVQELEATGVSVIEIEDNVMPQRLDVGHYGGGLISKDEHVGKLRAALDARRDPSTIIVARTSAPAELPPEEAMDRIQAYARTGVDGIMLPGYPPRGRADIEALHQASDLPLLLLGLPPEDVADTAFLAANKVRIRYMGQPVYSMAVKAIYDSLKLLKEGGSAAELRDREASRALLDAVNRTAELKEWEAKYAPPRAGSAAL